MSKQKQAKIKPAEAIKVLANELNGLRKIVQKVAQDTHSLQLNLRDFATVFDSYVNFKKDSDKFVKHLDELLAKQKEQEKEIRSESETDEQTDGQDLAKDTINKE